MTGETNLSAIELPPSVDASAARVLAAALLAERGKPVRIDASHVEKIGTLGIQVLLSARLTWAADRAAMRIINPSERFKEAFALLGITETTGRFLT